MEFKFSSLLIAKLCVPLLSVSFKEENYAVKYFCFFSLPLSSFSFSKRKLIHDLQSVQILIHL